MLSRLDDFADNDGPMDAEAASEDPFLDFLPPQIVAQGVYKLFYLGYRAAFHLIRTMLSIPEAAPTASTLRVEFVQGARDGKYQRYVGVGEMRAHRANQRARTLLCYG